MTEDVPPALHPPVSLALAKAVETVPAEDALPGGCLYEPKLDGYRLCALAGSGGVSLWSRQGKDLTRYLPDLQAAIEAQVPSVFELFGRLAAVGSETVVIDPLSSSSSAARCGLAAALPYWHGAPAFLNLCIATKPSLIE